MRHRIFSFLLIVISSLSATAFDMQAAGTTPNNAKERGDQGPPATKAPYVALENKNAMKITLRASRDQATAGSNFGITAQIENTSRLPIYVMPASIALTVPPELDEAGPRDVYAFIPGVQPSQGRDYWSTVVVLEPGSTISTFWTGGNAAAESQGTTRWRAKLCRYLGPDCSAFFRGLTFNPSRYTLSVVGSYWDTYEGAQKKIVERHTQTAEIQEVITAPQSVILFGAALGGVIAFLLLKKLQPDSTTGWSSVHWIPGILSAILLSTIVTIMLARLSQSQFIVSVTVNDVWGAIATGFIITAAGPAVLQKFTSLVGGSTGTGTSLAPGKTTAAPATTPASQAGSPAPGTAPSGTTTPASAEAVQTGPNGSSRSPAPRRDGKGIDTSSTTTVPDAGEGHGTVVTVPTGSKGGDEPSATGKADDVKT